MSLISQNKKFRTSTGLSSSTQPLHTNPTDLVDQGDVQALLDEFAYEIDVLFSSSLPASQLQSCKRCIDLVLHPKLTLITSKVSTGNTYSKLASALQKANSDLAKSILTLGLLLLRSNANNPALQVSLEVFSIQFLQVILEVHVTCAQNNVSQQSAQNMAFHTKRKFKATEPNPTSQTHMNTHAHSHTHTHTYTILKALHTLFGSMSDDVVLLQTVYVNRYFTLLLECMDKFKCSSEGDNDDHTHTHTNTQSAYRKLVRCLQEAQVRVSKSFHTRHPSYIHCVCKYVQACIQGEGVCDSYGDGYGVPIPRYLWLLLGILECVCYMCPTNQKHILTYKMRDGYVIACMCMYMDSIHCKAFKEVMGMGHLQSVYGLHRGECNVAWELFKDLHTYTHAPPSHTHAHAKTASPSPSPSSPPIHVSVGDGDVYASLLKCMIGVCNVYALGKG
ncbi:hypothetical protein EON65_38445, partial [archaeon]